MLYINALHRRILSARPSAIFDPDLLEATLSDAEAHGLEYLSAAKAARASYPDELHIAAGWHQQAMNILLQAREIRRAYGSGMATLAASGVK